jgi:hypothetical protein
MSTILDIVFKVGIRFPIFGLNVYFLACARHDLLRCHSVFVQLQTLLDRVLEVLLFIGRRSVST